MAGIQNTKLKGLLAPRVIKQRGFLKQGLERTLISSDLSSICSSCWKTLSKLTQPTCSVLHSQFLFSEMESQKSQTTHALCHKSRAAGENRGVLWNWGEAKEIETSLGCPLTV